MAAELGLSRDDITDVIYGRRKKVVPAGGNDVVALTFWGRTRTGRAVIVWTRRLLADDDDASAVADHQIIGITDMTPQQLKTFTEWEGEQ
ncbi:MAG: hypothetical protein JWN03_2622 [Nocardia sp.]|uniref:hypothetical protein n=1 Tax=Nocardia sp. TaxID=1821 RepID=UPI00262618A1|nr:hypothetical protein [Nocardia sp.]MCU1642347.1 hypothetical protein [Nocardia sp.]